MANLIKNIRQTNITVSLHEKNNIYQAIINYKDENLKRKQKWISTGIKVARGNKKRTLKKAEEYRIEFENLFNLKEQIKQENDEQSKKYLRFREKLHFIDSSKYYDENFKCSTCGATYSSYNSSISKKNIFYYTSGSSK